MLKILAALVALVLPTAALAQTPPPEPIEVMVLGTYHFGNPGQDERHEGGEDFQHRRAPRGFTG